MNDLLINTEDNVPGVNVREGGRRLREREEERDRERDGG